MISTLSPTLTANLPTLDFDLPAELEAASPPEARGLSRDDVRLMVSYYQSDLLTHTAFNKIGRFLHPGDVVVINTSATLPAAIKGSYRDQTPVHVHFSTRLHDRTHVIELRHPTPNGTKPFKTGKVGAVIRLVDGAYMRLMQPYGDPTTHSNGNVRLWQAHLHGPLLLPSLLKNHGFPIRYGYVKEHWPLDYYQTVYANEPGSAEMPSAGRAFSAELITSLVASGVQFAPLVLHTGVASLEDHEPPYAEYYRVPDNTARMVNLARQNGKRVIAVGTTSVRALESVSDENGWVNPGEGWTDLIISPNRPMRVVNGLLTGLHEPKATHLAMLEALTGQAHLQFTYAAALEKAYLWHEFGDLHLLLP